MSSYHVPVLLQKIIEISELQEGRSFVDCTLGGGGHFVPLLQQLNSKGVAIGVDQDEEALAEVKNKLQSKQITLTKDNQNFIFNQVDLRIFLIKQNFNQFENLLTIANIEKVDFVLADLGVSSHQLDSNTRGFSFKENQRLDMRMDQNNDGATAVDLVNGLYENELERIIREYGEERYARRIAKEIVEYRKTKKIETTTDLYNIVQKAVPYKDTKYLKGSAQRVFQALRILLNDELAALHELLSQALDKLNNNGKIAVISYHSLEDRIVKNFIKQNNKVIYKNSIYYPDEEEIASNPRARSAKLRLIEFREEVS
ncbi:16S rRNA (cytosine(1402)-N(4))-methyltransferase RsmH [Candidatus Dojkabacteria bacterium]|uniref:Ribosomal RNA small subunit methyltransferase H n=1 Tax=Candidatus Dojkabacteria bacterium TaxID=2099670 RepID=A0A955L3T0_9BACT|nr:16S rRNA (cytosine(1402)-N(4))-methyltransferase RsmH [Candidatus Dojkabacteria bacterium]